MNNLSEADSEALKALREFYYGDGEDKMAGGRMLFMVFTLGVGIVCAGIAAWMYYR